MEGAGDRCSSCCFSGPFNPCRYAATVLSGFLAIPSFGVRPISSVIAVLGFTRVSYEATLVIAATRRSRLGAKNGGGTSGP